MSRIIVTIAALIAITAHARDLRLNIDYTRSTQPTIFWYQAEQVDLAATFVDDPGLSVPGTEVYWDITAASGAPLYLSIPCTITSNQVSASLQPTNSNLEAGSYRGYLRLENGSTNLILSRQRINVYWSTAGGTYPVVGPLELLVPTTGIFRVSLALTNLYSAEIVGDQLQLTVNTNTGPTTVDWSHLDPEISNAIASAEGSLNATNTPSAGQMLYASGTNPAALYFAPAPEGGTSGGASLPSNNLVGAGTYALTRTITGSTTSDQWQIISGQLSTILNASFVADTNWTTVKFYANGTNEQTYTIPAGVTQAIVKCWGGGGGAGFASGGDGGTSYQPISVNPLAVLTFRVSTDQGWPGGGTNSAGGAAGGGYSGAFIGTNILVIAGGGGGSGSSISGDGGDGGGLAGEDGGGYKRGYGGTQESGGSSGGGFLQGGSSDTVGRGCGGGGYYGGGASTDYRGSGGGGSGYISSIYGLTFQGVITGDEDYEAGIGVAGGSGMIVIKHPTP